MIFGFNTDVRGSGTTYHVQTEDRGAKNPIVDSIIYLGGKIVDRVRTHYDADSATQEEIEAMVHNQHRDLVESIRTGKFRPTFATTPVDPLAPSGFGIRLLNAQNLARDGQLCFEFAVWSRTELGPVHDATLILKFMPGGGEVQEMSLQTEEDGRALATFEIPESERESLLVVCVKSQEGRDFAKFRVQPGPTAAAI